MASIILTKQLARIALYYRRTSQRTDYL